jgi:sRNA-binding carbon storage regulator CsrA
MIVVNVDEIRPGSVKLSVSAPPSVIINRNEIYELKQENRRERKD